MINRKITILGPEGTNLYILLQFILFNIISWFTLFTSVKSIEFDTENILSRQVVFSIIGLVVFFLTTYLSIENLYNLINPLFILSISVLGGLLFTMPILGVRRWYDLDAIGLPIFIQPSEFSKIILVLFLAKILSSGTSKIIAAVAILLNLFLIFIQPDLGTTLLLLIVSAIMLFLSDIKLRIAILGLLIIFFAFFVFLELNLLGEYQVSRITEFFSGEDFSQQQSRFTRYVFYKFSINRSFCSSSNNRFYIFFIFKKFWFFWRITTNFFMDFIFY